MNKIKALYVNEMIKIFHRPAVIIVAAVALCISFLFPILLMIVEGPYEFYNEETNEREKIESSLKDNEKDLINAGFKTTKQDVTIEVDGQEKTIPMTLYIGNDIPNLLSTKIVYEDLLANYDFAKYPTRKTWLAHIALVRYNNFELKRINLEMTPFEERDAEWLKEYDRFTVARDVARKALFEHDYKYYIEAVKYLEQGDYGSDYTPEMIKRLADTDPNGELGVEDGYYILYYLSQLQETQSKLDAGLDAAGNLPRILTEEKKEILRNTIKILNYEIDNHNIYDEKSTVALTLVYLTGKISGYALLVLLILIAGSSVSQEMATGSIKSLIIAPVKRWKIFTSKLLSIVTCMVVASVVLTLCSIIGTGFACGFDKLPPYLYVSGGAVKAVPLFLGKIFFDLVNNIPTFFYAFVGFMISCYTKNTGVSVGTAIGLSLFHEVPSMLQSSDLPQRILDFTPLAGMDIASKLFPYYSLMVADEDFDMFSLSNSSFDNSLMFCTVYIIVICFTVLFIAFEQFSKKDIQ